LLNSTNQSGWLRRGRGWLAIRRAEEVDAALEVLQSLRKGVRNVAYTIEEGGLGSIRRLVPPIHARTSIVHLDSSRKHDKNVCREVAMHGETFLGVGN
jgi:hypothetical protein